MSRLLFFLVVAFAGRCGHVRLPPRHGLPCAPAGERARAAVRGRHQDMGAGLVPAVLGRTALAAAHADAVVPWGGVGGAERVWGVLSAEAPGERGGKGAGARSAPGVDRMPGERGGGMRTACAWTWVNPNNSCLPGRRPRLHVWRMSKVGHMIDEVGGEKRGGEG